MKLKNSHDNWKIDDAGNAKLEKEGTIITVNGIVLTKFNFTNNYKVLQQIATHYYECVGQSGIRLSGGKIGIIKLDKNNLIAKSQNIHTKKENGAFSVGGFAFTLSKDEICIVVDTDGYVKSSRLENKYNFENALIHEEKHRRQFQESGNTYNNNEYLWETEAIFTQVKHSSWNNVTSSFKTNLLNKNLDPNLRGLYQWSTSSPYYKKKIDEMLPVFEEKFDINIMFKKFDYKRFIMETTPRK